MPGIAASTSETCVLGSPPNAVEAAENSLEREVTCACTSRPTITSQSPVAPLMSFALALSVAMWIALFSSEVRRDLSAGSSCPPRLGKRHSARRLLNRLAECEQRLLVERTADELQPERQAIARQACGRDKSWQTGHVDGHGEDVVEVHFDRIVRALLTDPEGGGGGGGGQNRIDAVGEHALEVALDEGADFLRPYIIGVVVAGGEHVGADHQTPSHFWPEAPGASLLVKLGDVGPRLSQAVAHAVIAREIARGFRGRHYIISRQRVGRVRQADLNDACAGGAKPFGAARPQSVDLAAHALEAIFLRHPDLHALDRASDRDFVVWNGGRRASGILRVGPGHRPQHDGGVTHGARERSRLIERRGDGDHAISPARALSRLQLGGSQGEATGP